MTEKPQVAGSDTTDLPLVLCLLGTDFHPFNRLVGWADEAAAVMAGGVRFLVQYGASRAPSRADGEEYLDHDKLTALMAEASAVVCHGGPATIMEARSVGHVPIVVPRNPALRGARRQPPDAFHSPPRRPIVRPERGQCRNLP